ncbi:DMT family transporter [Enterococcus sp. HY326]|uniref:DMT family transporter n=1 Tax=Enterococcus sp. HY326 TaxID=2971265 RepID=UPI00223E9F57|nr:DMT family transporter [Enterococcus sp. HY326]
MAISGRTKGVALAATGATLWGINGAFADVVFSKYNAPVEWVVGTRLLIAGILILLYAKLILKQDVFSIFKSKKDTGMLFLFGLIGMIGCQYLFFLSIGTNGAGLATILQFTSPIFIYLYLVIKKEKSVFVKEVFYIMTTFLGVFLIVTRGNFSQLSVSPIGLIIGVGSAVGVAFYTLQPRRLLKAYGAPIITGWGMLIGGGAFQFIHPIWRPGFAVDFNVVLYMAFIIVVGTAIAFSCYLGSVNFIEASLSNILAAMEPLVANILTPLLLGQSWTLVQIAGILLVLISVILFANYGEKIRKKNTSIIVDS